MIDNSTGKVHGKVDEVKLYPADIFLPNHHSSWNSVHVHASQEVDLQNKSVSHFKVYLKRQSFLLWIKNNKWSAQTISKNKS